MSITISASPRRREPAGLLRPVSPLTSHGVVVMPGLVSINVETVAADEGTVGEPTEKRSG
jgi:hypothetical protein